MNDQSPDLDLSTSADATRGPISRRTVLAGTAFAVPAIALTASAPAFAASGLTLAFNQSSYSGQGCSTITGAKVSVTNGGTPKAGVDVTVSLSNGYTFSSGGTTSTGVSSSDGYVTLPGINVPGKGGSGTATATSSGSSAVSAALSGTTSESFAWLEGVAPTPTVGVPSGSTLAWGAVFLTPDGRLLDGASGNLIVSNVDSVGQYALGPDGNSFVPLKMRDGSFAWLEGVAPTPTVGVPSGSTLAWGAVFLTPDGRLLDGRNGNLIVSNVDSVGQYALGYDGNSFVPLKMRDGSFAWLEGVAPTPTVGVPSGSTLAWGAVFLTPDGRLLDGASGNLIVSNVDSVGQYALGPDGNSFVPLKMRDGSFAWLEGVAPTPTVGVPSGSTLAWGAVFLTPDGRLLDGRNGNLIVSNVDSVGQYALGYDGNSFVPLKMRARC
ncbi:hypothetical protein QE430_002543 [Microbacterium testaceum]|uniref:hypothetical protein n=1 Tax=Microbacterium testaceum TaxID=2033 RepID=UPI00277E5770|nr:hypothetical protein [Microbacterium testaceum]MDQ1174236.1 hypothetical protein [Microbacterium testaceum]